MSILILRFSNNLDKTESPPSYSDVNRNFTEASGLTRQSERMTMGVFCQQIFNIQRVGYPTAISMIVSATLVGLYSICALGLALTIFYAGDDVLLGEPYAITLTAIFLFFVVLIIVALSVQPRERTPDAFYVPFVPLLPCISIFVNIFLMLMLDHYTWIRFAIWMLIGK